MLYQFNFKTHDKRFCIMPIDTQNPRMSDLNEIIGYFDFKSVLNRSNITIYPTGASIVNITDYSPFGVQLDGRTVESEDYRYGFQGQEADDEIKGKGNSVNYKYRMHDPRVGRFFAVDPLTKKYPHYTPYSFSGNKVIYAIELEGLEDRIIILSSTYDGGQRVIERSNSETISSFVAERDSWSNAYVNYDEAWDVNSNQSYFKLMQLDNSFLFKGTLTIDLRTSNPKASFTTTDNMMESVYIGPNNPEVLDNAIYTVYPQDVMDAAARVHDQNYDKEDVYGVSGVYSPKTTEANVLLVKTANKVIDMYLNNEIDPFTDMKISKKTYQRAQIVSAFFSTVIAEYLSLEEILLLHDFENFDINEATKRDDFD